jgi:hypothetical protein
MSTEHVFGTGKCGVEELDPISGAAVHQDEAVVNDVGEQCVRTDAAPL